MATAYFVSPTFDYSKGVGYQLKPLDGSAVNLLLCLFIGNSKDSLHTETETRPESDMIEMLHTHFPTFPKVIPGAS